jgi:type IV pilus assembly protein PilM
MTALFMGRTRTTTAVGLTIEPGGIAAAQVAVNGALVIQDGARAELDPAVVRDGEVADTGALADALRALWHDHGSLDKRVRIGVANTRIVVRTLYLPPIDDAKQLAAAVRFQAGDEIPMPLDDAVLDFHALGVVETPNGPRQRVVLVAARRDMILDVLTAARSAGLKPVGIDLSAFGMVRALQAAGDDAGPELFLSVGGLTNLAVAEAGVCSFTRVAGSGLERRREPGDRDRGPGEHDAPHGATALDLALMEVQRAAHLLGDAPHARGEHGARDGDEKIVAVDLARLALEADVVKPHAGVL